MWSFEAINEVGLSIRKMPKSRRGREREAEQLSPLCGLLLVESLLLGQRDERWDRAYRKFCGIRPARGAALLEGNPSEEELLLEVIDACDEDVLLALLERFGENSKLGEHIRARLDALNAKKPPLEQGIANELRAPRDSFYLLLSDCIREAGFESDAAYYNKILFSRRLFSKMRHPDYSLSRENALWLIVGLETDYAKFTRLFSAAGYSLRQNDRRDTIIAYVLKHGAYTLDSLNEMLVYFGEEPIGVG